MSGLGFITMLIGGVKVKKLLKQVNREMSMLWTRPLDQFPLPIHNDDELRRYKAGMEEVRQMIIQAIEKELK